MKKMLLALVMLLGIAAAAPASAQLIIVQPTPIYPVYPVQPIYVVQPVIQPVYQCRLTLVPTTTYALAWNGFQYVYQPTIQYTYQYTCGY